MKYVEIILIFMCINISISVLSTLCLMPLNPYTNDCQVTAGSADLTLIGDEYLINKSEINSSDNINTEIVNAINKAKYSKTGFQTNLLQDTDFLTGIWVFAEILIKGIFVISPTLDAFGIPHEIQFIFMVPIYFMYLLAFFQIISGRSIEQNK